MYLSCIVTFDASPICVRTMHDSVFRVNRGQQKSRLNEYMFMNKISMSKTCLYKFSCKKATGFLQQPVATEGIWLQFSITLTSLQYTVE